MLVVKSYKNVEIKIETVRNHNLTIAAEYATIKSSSVIR